ncbi:MAG: signal peptidase I [Spirochaetales bacterium]|nr:signal peptidase I [Spirochaetales bacterium]
MNTVGKKLVLFTEDIIFKFENRKNRGRVKITNHNHVLDWVFAFLWAIIFVLIVNQYFFQAYSIPSKSMDQTLTANDRVLINKIIYGPELLPGKFKLPSPYSAKRSDIVVFNNPEHEYKGLFFEILQRVIFMLTLSLVDLDKDINGLPAQHYLIKRVVGVSGDYISFKDGELYIRNKALEEFKTGSDFFALNGLFDYSNRQLTPEIYKEIDSSIMNSVYNNNLSSEYFDDLYFSRLESYKYLNQLSPSGINYYQQYLKKELGFFIPNGWYFVLGDNRDNSKDSRSFGLIHKNDIIGKGGFIFWPFNRIGRIN